MPTNKTMTAILGFEILLKIESLCWKQLENIIFYAKTMI